MRRSKENPPPDTFNNVGRNSAQETKQKRNRRESVFEARKIDVFELENLQTGISRVPALFHFYFVNRRESLH